MTMRMFLCTGVPMAMGMTMLVVVTAVVLVAVPVIVSMVLVRAGGAMGTRAMRVGLVAVVGMGGVLAARVAAAGGGVRLCHGAI